jgi:hypothetical protein
MNTLNNENIIYVPNTLDGENIVSSHLEENALLIDGTNQMLANLNAGNHRVTHVSNAISSTDAVNKGQLDLKADTTYVDTNFLNKTTTTAQFVAGRVTFNSTTSGQSFPIIDLQNAITGSNNGMYLRFFKNFNRLPNTEIGSIVFADKDTISPAISRAVQLTASIDSASDPLLNITFDSGIFNPLTISNTQTILRNNDFYIKNKTTLENVFTYFNSTDKFTMSKPLDMNTTNKIINIAEPTNNQDVASKFYVDSHSANNNYLLRNGTLPMTGNLQMGSYKITNLLQPDDLNDAANKFYCDTQSANTHYLLRNGTLAMTGNLNLATHNLITTGDINCDGITADGNLSCADFNSGGNQILGTNSSGSLNVKSSSFFDADMLINNNYHLMLGGNPASTGGMRLVYDSAFQTNGTAYIDSRATSLKIRLTTISDPTTDRIEINNFATTIKNNLIVEGNTTLGNFPTGDTLTCNCQAKFPTTSKLTFEGGSILSFDSGAEIHGFRVKLKSVGTDYTISSGADLTNDGILCTNQYPDIITITMPVRAYVWNNRKIIIKSQTGNVKIKQATGTFSTTLNNSTADYDITTDYVCVTHLFDSDFGTNGKIWSI